MAAYHHAQHEITLEYACGNAFRGGNKREAIQLLAFIKLPANFRTNTQYGVSLLHCAAYHGCQDVVCKLVLKCNCNVNYCNSKGRTALHYSAVMGRPLILQDGGV